MDGEAILESRPRFGKRSWLKKMTWTKQRILVGFRTHRTSCVTPNRGGRCPSKDLQKIWIDHSSVYSWHQATLDQKIKDLQKMWKCNTNGFKGTGFDSGEDSYSILVLDTGVFIPWHRLPFIVKWVYEGLFPSACSLLDELADYLQYLLYCK